MERECFIKIPVDVLDSIADQLPPEARFTKDLDSDCLVFWVPGGTKVILQA